MSDTRFSWSRIDRLNGAIELQARAKRDSRCRRVLTKDSALECWNPDCRKKPKRGDECYYPAAGLSESNKVIGHVACIDAMVARVKGVDLKADSHIVLPPTAAAPVAQPISLSVPVDPLAQLERIRQEIWNEGYQAGIAAALAKLTGLQPHAGTEQEPRHA